jgi:hypothetical protein
MIILNVSQSFLIKINNKLYMPKKSLKFILVIMNFPLYLTEILFVIRPLFKSKKIKKKLKQN